MQKFWKTREKCQTWNTLKTPIWTRHFAASDYPIKTMHSDHANSCWADCWPNPQQIRQQQGVLSHRNKGACSSFTFETSILTSLCLIQHQHVFLVLECWNILLHVTMQITTCSQPLPMFERSIALLSRTPPWCCLYNEQTIAHLSLSPNKETDTSESDQCLRRRRKWPLNPRQCRSKRRATGRAGLDSSRGQEAAAHLMSARRRETSTSVQTITSRGSGSSSCCCSASSRWRTTGRCSREASEWLINSISHTIDSFCWNFCFRLSLIRCWLDWKCFFV